MGILCFGDSNTYGYDPRSYIGDRYTAENRWPDLLAKQVNCAIINDGVCGRGIPISFPSSLRDRSKDDCILVMLGTNDLLQGDTAAQAACKMEQFLTQLPFHHIVLIAPPPMIRGAWVPTDALVYQSTLLAEEYRTIAQKHSLAFIDTRQWSIPLTFDGVHFTEAGHRMFAQRLLPILKPYLQEMIP